MPQSNTDVASDIGRYLRAQREIAQVSLRSLARLTSVSDSYLSQIERGLYQPSPDVLRAIAEGLGLSTDQLFRRMGWLPAADGDRRFSGVLDAVAGDEFLTKSQKAALSQTYKAMVGTD